MTVRVIFKYYYHYTCTCIKDIVSSNYILVLELEVRNLFSVRTHCTIYEVVSNTFVYHHNHITTISIWYVVAGQYGCYDRVNDY